MNRWVGKMVGGIWTMPFAECWEGDIWISVFTAANRPWPFVLEMCLIHTVVLRVWFVQQESHCSPTATEALQGLAHKHTHRRGNFLYYCHVMHRRWTTGSQTHAHKHKHPLGAQRHKHVCGSREARSRHKAVSLALWAECRSHAAPVTGKTNHWWVLPFISCFSEQNGEEIEM